MPGQPVVLDNFGGIVTTARPEDLPEGASPRNNDVDFVVGRFIQRPGLQSVYTNILTVYGPMAPTVAADVDTEAFPWTNVNRILLNDGSFTTISLLGQGAASAVVITGGGYYALTETVTVTFSGTGTPATGTAITANVTPPTGPHYKIVTGVNIISPGAVTGTMTVAFAGAASPTNNATGTVTLAPTGQTSDNIRLTGFRFAVPNSYQIKSLTVSVKGFATASTVHVQMLKAGVLVGDVKSGALPTTNNFVSLGGDLWGTTWDFADADDTTNFGCEIYVNSTTADDISLDFLEIAISGIALNANFTGITDAKLKQVDQVILALDGNGLTWEEDVTGNPNVLFLQSLVPVVTPGAYLKGIDAGGKAYMAFSNLTQGISQPMQFNGEWCDRITQVGPGQAPVFTPQQATGTTFPITSITQHPANSDVTDPGHISVLLQSAGPGSTSPGNVITVYYSPSFFSGSPQPSAEDVTLVNLFNSGTPTYVYISGTGIVDGTYLVTSVGNALPPGVDHWRFYFTVQAASSAYQRIIEAAGQYQQTIAALATTDPVPDLVVGNTVTMAGASVAGWDANWTIVQALNSGEMVITQTSVIGGVATYNYSLVSGSAPAAGELVTVTNTTNANGVLNVVNAVIVSASGGPTGTFTVTVSVTSAAAVVETGQATTAGTQFTIDPGPAAVGTATNPIIGNSTGGTLTFSTGTTGQFITAGTKQGSVFFITRNGAVTRPAPPSTFVIPANTGSIAASQIVVGPPDVVARGITFTESGQNGVTGANFYFYDTPVTYTVNGTKFTSDALIIPNNVDTTWTFSFSDQVLLTSDEIDIPGNNYFNLIELGNPAWMFQYANRMLYGLCQTKIQNFLNLTFDGGFLPTLSNLLPQPSGWNMQQNGNTGAYPVTAFSITNNEVTVFTVNSLRQGYTVSIQGLTTGTYLNNVNLQIDTASGTQFTASFAHADIGLTTDSGTVFTIDSPIGLTASLDFGNALRIFNYGASGWTNATVAFQPAYQDYLGVNIIQPNTPYSVRLKGRSAGADGQTVTVQLPTYASGVFGPSNGSAVFTLNRGTYTIQTAALITGDGLTVIPSTMQLAIGVSALAVGTGVEIDRIEIYPTNNPVDTTTIWTSYVDKFESVDIVTGQLGVGAENTQPATGAYEILEQLYIEKTNSIQVTQDSPNYEPNNWQVRQASDRAGAVGPNAFDEGEEFALMASRSGVYYFDGGKPMPILRELQNAGKNLNLWEYVNWNAGSTIWVRNDLNNRRLMIGIPMITPNPWLPTTATVTPTSPNVILMCNYTGCPTGEELAQSSEVHVTMFGDLKDIDMRRHWSLWIIQCPIAEFVPRQDSFSDPLFLCNGIQSSKIYRLASGAASGGQNTDDGAAINWRYTTYGFVKAKQGQQSGLSAFRKVWYYLTATMEGAGQVIGRLYSNSLGALPRNIFTIPLPFTLSYPQQDDQERVLEIGGQRVFLEFTSAGTGGYAEIGPVMLDGEVDKNSPHRGVAV